jgi:hypothetical protein
MLVDRVAARTFAVVMPGWLIRFLACTWYRGWKSSQCGAAAAAAGSRPVSERVILPVAS